MKSRMSSRRLTYDLILVFLPVLVLAHTSASADSKIYWAEQCNRKIERANLDGSEREVLVNTGPGFGGPRGLTLDIFSNKMYWTDCTNDKIRRANLDGSVVEDLVTNTVFPRFISLDLISNKMYWIESDGHYKIKRANLDGSGAELLLESGVDDLLSPFGFALDISRGHMYWSELDEGSIKRANLDGSEIRRIITGLNMPEAMAIDSLRRHIYWVDQTRGSIWRANLDGSDVRRFIYRGHNSNPSDLAIDVVGGKIYWMDAVQDKIQRANLDGTGVEDIITTGLNCTRGMALYIIPEIREYYVNAVMGNDNNSGLSPGTALKTIQKGIDKTEDGDTILVYPGIYREEINFLGKAITVQGIATKAGIAVLENPGDFAVSFYNGEGPDSVLKNFIIKNSFMAIFIAGSSPTISNITVVNNKYGAEAYTGAEPDISNSIFWNNTNGDLFQCQSRYSLIERGSTGEGNIDTEPLFADLANGDYHLLSERGRYWPRYDIWVLDKVTSLCVDRGDLHADSLDEPMPNGGRINMGAYGGTAYASMSEMRWLDGDINHDSVVNIQDFAILAENWLKIQLLTSNLSPIVNIINPKSGTDIIIEGTRVPIKIEADAWDIDGSVVKVEFFADGNKIGEDNDSADGWQTDWSGYRTEEHRHYILTAKATDNEGVTTTSPGVGILVFMPFPPPGQ